MAIAWYICEKNDSCIDCPIIYKDEEQCNHMIEVEVVVRAEWITGKTGIHTCSNCGSVRPYDVQADIIEYWDCPRCPKCGAIMSE